MPRYKKPDKKVDKTKALLQQAIKHMDVGKYGPAESVLSELLSATPGDPEVCRLLAMLHLKRGELTIARGEIKFLAAAAMRAQDYALAESMICDYLAVDPTCVALLELLGRTYEEKGDHEAAVLEYGKAVDTLLRHPDPELSTLPAELYENIKSLAPTSTVAERLAPFFGPAPPPLPAEALFETAQPAAPPVPAEPDYRAESALLRLQVGEATKADAPEPVGSITSPDTPVAEERVPFPNVNRMEPASLHLREEEPAEPIVQEQPQEQLMKPAVDGALSPEPDMPVTSAVEPGLQEPFVEEQVIAAVPPAAPPVQDIVEELRVAPVEPEVRVPTAPTPSLAKKVVEFSLKALSFETVAPPAPPPSAAPPVQETVEEPPVVPVPSKVWVPPAPPPPPTEEVMASGFRRPPGRGIPPRMPTREPVRTIRRARPSRASYLLHRFSVLIGSGLAAAWSVLRSVVFFLTIGLAIPLLICAIAAVWWYGMEEKPESAFQALTQIPAPRAVQEPSKNGYFLLLGIGSGASRDPVKTGYERWQGRERAQSDQCLDKGTESQSSLRSAGGTHDTGAWFEASDPVTHFQKETGRLQTWLTQHNALLNHYRQWLTMPFEDMGYGHLQSPDCAQILVAHRLYLAEGFSQKMEEGVDRLERDLSAWRAVLGQAKTLPIKLMAAAAVNEDLAVLSGLLNRRELAPQVLRRLTKLARPLDEVERSLRWPMQNEFVLQVKTVERELTPEAGVERSFLIRVLTSMPLPKQKTFNAYARYYEAAIKAVGIPNNPLPKLYDFARTPPRTVFDYFVNPFDNILATGSKPNWNHYAGLILETDARLRLVSLQVRLRDPSQRLKLFARIAMAGQNFYDPFTSLPMLWNAEKGRLYSVGSDGKDNAGDPKLDVSVPIVVLGP